MTIAASVACLLALLLIAFLFPAPVRVAATLLDAAISENLVTVPLAVAHVFRKIRNEAFPVNKLPFTTRPFALKFITNGFISESFTNSKVAGE